MLILIVWGQKEKSHSIFPAVFCLGFYFHQWECCTLAKPVLWVILLAVARESFTPSIRSIFREHLLYAPDSSGSPYSNEQNPVPGPVELWVWYVPSIKTWLFIILTWCKTKLSMVCFTDFFFSLFHPFLFLLVLKWLSLGRRSGYNPNFHQHAQDHRA